jgi:hypothetical protein
VISRRGLSFLPVLGAIAFPAACPASLMSASVCVDTAASKLGLLAFFPHDMVIISFDIFLTNYMELSTTRERPPVVKPLYGFTTFYGTRRFIAASTRALHLSVS